MLITLKTISVSKKIQICFTVKRYDSYSTHLFMVDCPSSTYPSFLVKKKNSSIRLGLLGPHCNKMVELWARALVLTPEPSQANHSNDGKQSKTRFLSVAVWEPGTCGQDMGTRRSWSRFPHDEIDTALNSQVRQRTLQARGAPSETEGGMALHQSRLWPWVAAPHGDRESHRLRPWTSSATRTPTKSSANS